MRCAVLLLTCALLPAQSLDQAYEALRGRDYAAAIAHFHEAIAAAPGNTVARKDLAYTYLKVGENALARAQFYEVMQRDPNDSTVALDYAYLCYEAKEQAEARRIFDRIRKGWGPAAATAEEAFQNIDAPLVQGIERWKNAIAMGADDFSAHYELAGLAEKRDDLPLAAEHYLKAWQRLPDRRGVLVQLGRVWLAMGRAEDANAALLAAWRGGEPRAAEEARGLLPDRYPFVSEFRRALELDPKNVALRRELGYLLLRIGQQPAAEQEFRILTEAAPDDLLSATQLGFLLQARGEEAAAKPLFDRVLAGKDEDLANRVRAVLHMEQVLQKRDPTPATSADAVSAREMAERSIKAGYIKDAARYLVNAHEADPKDATIMLRLGWAYNILHDDGQAIHWFDLARKSGDPAVSDEAQRAWRGLHASSKRFQTTVWLFPTFSSRWHDLFGYGQIKEEVRTGIGLRPYISARIVGDTRVTTRSPVPQYLSEDSLILGVGLATTPWHGMFAWGEAGRAMNYVSHQRLPDYRGGVSISRGAGHPLHGESPGWFANTTTDAVYVSRFDHDILVYNQERVGYTLGPPSLRAQVHGVFNVTFDDKREYWANYGEAGLGLRWGGTWLPGPMYFSFEAVRGVYFVNAGNPRRPNFYDFRAGMWYAFTK